MRMLSRKSVIVIGTGVAVLLLAVLAAGSRAGDTGTPRSAPRHLVLRGVELRAVSQAAGEGVAELLGKGGYPVLAWNRRTALWGGHTPPNWWQSALALDGLLRYAERTGGGSWLQPVLVRVYDRNVLRPHSRARLDFANEFMDDTAWWGQTWADAAHFELVARHDLPAARRYLAVAEHDARYIARHPRPCGGIEWELGTGTDTVTNAEFVTLVAQLARLRAAPGPLHSAALARRWRRVALATLGWLEHSGLVDVSSGKLHDGLGRTCHSYSGAPMTYTEGEMAEALVRVGQMTGRRTYLEQARRFLDYATGPRSGLVRDGVLQEHCEATVAQCADLVNRGDMPAYKGILVEALGDWDLVSHTHAYAAFLREQAAAVLRDAVRGPHSTPGHCATPDTCRFTFRWHPARPLPGALRRHALQISVASQVSALDALASVLPAPAWLSR